MHLFSTKVAYAASMNLDGFLRNVNAFIINPLIVFLIALALAYFLYGVFEFIANGANDEKKTTGKSHMMWGVIGLTIMMGVWAILGMILSTFNINYVNPKEGTVNDLPN
jgi:uncharacterized membrane protein YidH (DUF202 family)